MTHSLNEIEAMAKKAARGAGLPWGLADDAGRAVRWLCARGLGAAEALAELLEQTDYSDPVAHAPVALRGDWGSERGSLCPLAAGTTLGDFARGLAALFAVETGGFDQPVVFVEGSVLKFLRDILPAGKIDEIQATWRDNLWGARPPGVEHTALTAIDDRTRHQIA